jgi:hypothetical protein
MNRYRYRIKSTGESSAKYGACEVCGKHVSEVFYQVEEKFFRFPAGSGWTQHDCRSYFGHRACLMDRRRGHKQMEPS